jgi:hypothetical protein
MVAIPLLVLSSNRKSRSITRVTYIPSHAKPTYHSNLYGPASHVAFYTPMS